MPPSSTRRRSSTHPPRSSRNRPSRPRASRHSTRSHRRTPTTTLHVYTYGYSYRDGQRGSRGAYGIHIHTHTPIDDITGNSGRLIPMQNKQTRTVASLFAVEKVVEAMVMKRIPGLAIQRTLRNAHRDPNTTIVLHVDQPMVVDVCTTLGARLETLAFPPRTDRERIERLYKMVRPLLKPSYNTSSLSSSRPPLRIVCSTPKTNARDHQGTLCARTLARSEIKRAVHTTESQMFKVNYGCAFDDDRRMYLKVPPHEYNYAKSKGAWWDLDSQRFYLYREPVDDPWTRDVGAMYDMRPTDWENLRQVFGGGVRSGSRV